jgi:hypothetical protein
MVAGGTTGTAVIGTGVSCAPSGRAGVGETVLDIKGASGFMGDSGTGMQRGNSCDPLPRRNRELHYSSVHEANETRPRAVIRDGEFVVFWAG